MADKVLTLKKSSLGKKIDTLTNEDMKRVNAALRAALGMGGGRLRCFIYAPQYARPDD